MQLQIAKRPSGHPVPEPDNTYFPRRLRADRRAAAAKAQATAQGLGAFAAADLAMQAAFGEFSRINHLKMLADSFIKRGPAVARGKFAAIAQTVSDDLDTAIVDIERAYRAGMAQLLLTHPDYRYCHTYNVREARVRQLEVARLILRLMRATGNEYRFALLREILLTPIWQPTACNVDGSYVEFGAADLPEWQ